MLDILNGFDETTWAGIGALLAATITGIVAAWRGTKKHPIEAGMPPPPVDQVPYVLAEVRELSRKHDEACKLTDRRFDEVDRLMAKIHLDTQVIRERDRR